MAGSAEKVLAEKKIELPKAAAPGANYVPVVTAGHLAFVRHGKADFQRVTVLDYSSIELQVRIFKLRIAQAEAEREQRLNAAAVIVPISDENPFRVSVTVIFSGVMKISWRILKTHREGHGQLSRRIGRAE